MPHHGAMAIHAPTHENGGTDEIDVTGLDGLLADPQTPVEHGPAEHTDKLRWLFIPATNDYQANATLAVLNYRSCINLTDNVTGVVPFTFQVPSDFVSFEKVELVWSAPVAAGNMRWRFVASYSADGEVNTTHTDVPAEGVTAVSGNGFTEIQEPADPLTLANLALGDNVGIQMTRDGSHADDTLDDIASILGILFSYMAEQ